MQNGSCAYLQNIVLHKAVWDSIGLKRREQKCCSSSIHCVLMYESYLEIIKLMYKENSVAEM